ncbi:hypothetical protein EV361DRAFT_943754 [Lentinula raphanica]|uniref:Uncharacterized protein n=1 Tax=Lentinula raphanica TaxID=153919 RepID=A0AA38ULD9_9AGAR|nr:hypothetical protein F5880DRAFT_1515917 [Lentinula raphanica]KAJ3845504.1 hypothetical protein F5878DRAFT_654867 [Lentinula raphanica]KAJ3978128.1 hypothetical protein EV361DRAFT_943754 [Lentinula raphanica]
MSNIGEKVKGAFNTVHGIGENIRATTLGAVDTIAHDKEGEYKNDQIAREGRMETQRGMDQMSGRQRTYGDTTTANANTNTVPAGSHANQSYTFDHDRARDTVSAEPPLTKSSFANTTSHPTTTGDFPGHHRDDEVYNDSQAQTVYDHGDVPSRSGYNTVGGVPEPSGSTMYGAGYGAGNNNLDSRYGVDAQYDASKRQY